MTRTVQALVGAALLMVLSGAPFLAVLCAQLCLEGAHPTSPTGSRPTGTNCHDDVRSAGPVLSTAVDLPCGDHDAALSAIPVFAAGKRVDVAAGVPNLAAPVALPARPPSVLLRARVPGPSRAGSAAPSHTVLRI